MANPNDRAKVQTEKLGNMRQTKRRLIQAAKAEYAELLAEVRKELAGSDFTEEMLRIVVAENVIRVAMEATFECSVPASEMLFREIALRLCSYSISALQPQDQQDAIQAVFDNLEMAHEMRTAQGIVISTDWHNGRLN